MNGRIFAIKRFEIHDGPGIRTTVFLKGCPLRCLWCHNPEGISREKQLAFNMSQCVSCGLCSHLCSCHTISERVHIYNRDACKACGECSSVCFTRALQFFGQDVEADNLAIELMKDKEFFEDSHGGVTLSGGEPLYQGAFALELLKRLKHSGVHTAVDTSGFAKDDIWQAVMEYTDMYLFDLKAADSTLHRKLTGVPNEQILKNLRALDKARKAVEIRIPLIPGLNDGEIPAIGHILQSLDHKPVICILPYHDFGIRKYHNLGMESKTENIFVPFRDNAGKSIVAKAIETLRSYDLNVYNGSDVETILRST